MREAAVLLVVVAVAALGVFGLGSHSCVSSNDTAAISSLRNIHSAQFALRDAAIVDADGDGTGEFGLFGELTGEHFLRGGTATLPQPLLSGAYRDVDETGAVHRSGFYFRMILPARDGGFVVERPQAARPVEVPAPQAAANGCRCCGTQRVPLVSVALSAPVDAEAAERAWWCVAWPQYDDSGLRSYFVDHTGRIFARDSVDDPGATPPGGAGWTEIG